MYVPTAALVTNLSVHFKQGAANSLIWVTTLEDARPVAGAAVAIADCHGRQLWAGTTDRQGLALVPKIEAVNNPLKCEDLKPTKYDFYTTQTEALRELSSGLLVTARLGNDFSFVHRAGATESSRGASICRWNGARPIWRRIPCWIGRCSGRARPST